MVTISKTDFQICMCSFCTDHGWIVFPDGTRSLEFLSEQQAVQVIETAFQESKMTPREAIKLTKVVQGFYSMNPDQRRQTLQKQTRTLINEPTSLHVDTEFQAPSRTLH